MKAIVHKTKYGNAQDFTSIDVPKPEAKGKDVLVKYISSIWTTSFRRILTIVAE